MYLKDFSFLNMVAVHLIYQISALTRHQIFNHLIG